MASISCASSSALIFNKTKLESNGGASLFQFNGLKAVESMQMCSPTFDKPKRN